MLGSFLLHSDDLGETEAILGANFAAIRIDANEEGASTRASIWRRNVGRFHVDEAQFGYDMCYDMAPPDEILLCRVRAGALEEQQSRGHVVFGPNRVVAFGACDGIPIRGSVRRARYDIISLDRSVLAEAAGDPAVRLTSSAPVNDDANQLLIDAFDYVRHGVVANPHAAQDGLMAGALTRFLAAAVLSALPHTTPSVSSVTGDETSPAQFRRAVAFIDEHAHTDISLADVAVAAGVTTRSLQHLFRRHSDCTPTEYLRKVRLHHAHDEIEAGLAATITQVAHRWGFANADRFVDHYLRTYGHRPALVSRN